MIQATNIMHDIKRLPTSQQMLIVENIIHSIRQREQPSMKMAAERLYDDYMNDKNLTVFTQLDCEDFYEAR